MRVLEDTKMAGLCNRPQWYPLQAADRLSLVAFYLTHDTIRRGYILGGLSCVHTCTHVLPAFAAVSFSCRRARGGALGHTGTRVHAQRAYDRHRHELKDAPLNPVSPVSIGAACMDEPGIRRRFERKSNPWKGQRTAWDARESIRPLPLLPRAHTRVPITRNMEKRPLFSIIVLEEFLERSRDLTR